jgi:hypothetical protein
MSLLFTKLCKKLWSSCSAAAPKTGIQNTLILPDPFCDVGLFYACVFQKTENLPNSGKWHRSICLQSIYNQAIAILALIWPYPSCRCTGMQRVILVV